MLNAFVTKRGQQTELDRPGCTTVSAQRYVSGLTLAALNSARILNACDTRMYKHIGSDLSLLAEARKYQSFSIANVVSAVYVDSMKQAMTLGSRKPLAVTAGGTKSRSVGSAKKTEYKLAILRDPHDPDAPSDQEAIHRFIRAGYRVNIDVSVIGYQDVDLLPAFDALFIRDTTSVNNYTYDFARQALAHGLIVIDDPQSIVRGSNKVYQAELFQRYGIPSPRTIIFPHNQPNKAGCLLGWPLVLKTSDGHSSLGVSRANTQSDLDECLWRLPQSSCELVLAQQFISSSFDWRIGVLAGRALYACRYYMVSGYWKIRNTENVGNKGYGRVETFALDAVPPRLIAIAERAARLIGNGLYGVDLKEVSGEFFVIEVNDNPTIDAGFEDDVLGEHLYLAVMKLFRERIARRAIFWRQQLDYL